MVDEKVPLSIEMLFGFITGAIYAFMFVLFASLFHNGTFIEMAVYSIWLCIPIVMLVLMVFVYKKYELLSIIFSTIPVIFIGIVYLLVK